MSKSLKVSHTTYILKDKTNEDEKGNTKWSVLVVVLFLLSGCPNSWNIQDSLWLELSWYEDSQPERETLSSWLILMQAVAALMFLLLLWIETHVMTFPKVATLYCASSATVIMGIVLSFGWNISLHGVSIILLLASFTGQTVGNVQYIFVIPWIAMNYNPRLISAFVSGNALMIINLVLLQILQEPGGSKNFTPSIYYLLAASIWALTFGFCVFTFTSGIARVTPKDAVLKWKPWRNSLWTQSFPPVFWETKFYTFARLWSNQWSWTVIPIALPYAAAHTTHDEEGKSFLQWTVAVGYCMMLVGSLASYIPTKKFWIVESLVLNTISNTVVLIAAGNLGDWRNWPMKLVLVISVMASRFSFGWVRPMILRDLSRRFPDQKELLVRSNSLWSLYANIVFRILLWLFASHVISY